MKDEALGGVERNDVGDGLASWPVPGQALASPMCCNSQRLGVVRATGQTGQAFWQISHFEFTGLREAVPSLRRLFES